MFISTIKHTTSKIDRRAWKMEWNLISPKPFNPDSKTLLLGKNMSPSEEYFMACDNS